LDCSERSLRGWLKGEHLPSSYYLGQISNVLDINAHSLFIGGDEDMEKLSRRGFVFLMGAGAGVVALNSWRRLDAALNSYVHIDQEALAQLQTITKSYWKLRTNFTSQELWHGVSGHLDNISQKLHQSLLPHTREQMCAIAGEVALLSGTMVHDMDDRT